MSCPGFKAYMTAARPRLSLVRPSSAPPRDAQRLMLEVAGGSRAAFQELAAHFAAPLVRFCSKQVADAAVGEELAQDVLLAVWQSRHRFIGGDAASWVFTIAVNRCRKHRRSLLRWFSSRARLESSADAGPDVIEALGNHQQAAQLRAALESLSEELREVLVLRLDTGLDYRSIGEAVGCTEGAARVRVHAAIRRLRGLMEVAP
jgi:RNA polymerase sigma-70 factor (ECF subfamily)